MSTLESRVIGVLARTADARTAAQVAEHIPQADRTDVAMAIARLVTDGAIERLRGPGALESYRLMYVPERDWDGMHVRMTLTGVTLAIVGAGFVALAAIFLWGMP